MVVSYNRAALLRRCLESLERCEGREEMQIVVVDNGSRDGSAELEQEFPNARFIRAPRNFGLTKALNIGFRAAEGEYIFLLHDDTEILSPETVKALAARLDSDNDVNVVCPLLVDENGAPAPQIGVFPPDNGWRPLNPDSAEPIPVDYARGAALMLRAFFLRAMRQLDERYGQFGSDADICFQSRRAGRKILVFPQLRTLHHGGAASPLRDADFQIGLARWLGKYQGLAAGLVKRVTAPLAALAGFRLSEFGYLVSGQKIDGTQPQ